MKMKILFFILLANFGCSSSSKNLSENAIIKSAQANSEIQEIIIDELYVKRKFDKKSEELRFKINKIEQQDAALKIDVQFGGGCLDNHVFELYTTGKPDENGVVDMYLLHKTTGDLCKALLMQPRYYNIGKLTNRKNISAFRINDSQVISLTKSK